MLNAAYHRGKWFMCIELFQDYKIKAFRLCEEQASPPPLPKKKFNSKAHVNTLLRDRMYIKQLQLLYYN